MITYQSGFKYQLIEDYEIETGIKGYSARTPYLSLYSTGRLVINKGYAWDGPSGPTIDTKNFMRGSLVHDALYQLMRMGKMGRSMGKRNRQQADRLLRTMCIEDGMWRVRAWWIYKSLRLFGGPAASKSGRRDSLTAP